MGIAGAVIAFASVVVAAEATQGICPSVGSCFRAHETPGCDDEACCNVVCALDPFCCENQWDSICADGAQKICGGAGPCPAEGDCVVPHPTPGCDDFACCDTVCDFDPFCCESEWDLICVNHAFGVCRIGDPPGCPGPGDCCMPHRTPSCEDKACCGLVCDTDPFCCEVVWDSLCVSEAETLCGICEGGGRSSCCLANDRPGCDDPACESAVCAMDSFCCEMEWDALCAGEASWVCGLCEPEGGGSKGDCCSASGLLGCFDPRCEAVVCSADPSCCLIGWDTSCVIQAVDLCTCDLKPACPGRGSCAEAHETPGCEDEACCLLLCQFDPICCAVIWDGSCVELAKRHCDLGPECACPGKGSCFEPHDGVGCVERNCCVKICNADPFCCEVEWDQICVNQTVLYCFGTCPFLDGNDVIDGGDIAVVLGAWGPCECVDPCPVDLDQNGVVDGGEIAIILGFWGVRGGCF